jgi:TusA-related sulfurtransferase
MGQHAGAADREVTGSAAAPGAPTGAEELDLRGEVCPYTFLKARLVLDAMPAGALLRVLVDNEASARDVPRSLIAAGHAVLACAPAGETVWAILVARSPA